MDIASIVNLGIGGFAILVMWWMYQSAREERTANDQRLDAKDEQFRSLEREVRTNIMKQLMDNTHAINSFIANREKQ